MNAWVIKMFNEYFCGISRDMFADEMFSKLNKACLFPTKKEAIEYADKNLDSNDAEIVKVKIAVAK